MSTHKKNSAAASGINTELSKDQKLAASEAEKATDSPEHQVLEP